MSAVPPTIEWVDGPMGGLVRTIDQRRLPGELAFLDCGTADEVCDAIASLAPTVPQQWGMTRAA